MKKREREREREKERERERERERNEALLGSLSNKSIDKFGISPDPG